MNEKDIPKTILIDVIDPSTSPEEAAQRLEELESLTHTFGGLVVLKIIQKRSRPNYRTFVGTGKIEEIAEEKPDLVIVNNILKPNQIYNLEDKLKDTKVWDRVDLILKIFEKHANSSEAKLQVKLASIKHMGPRIYKMGGELMRQEGRAGIRAGAGEANTEMMKRHLRRQELNILKKLKQYESVQKGHMKRRRRRNLKTAALIGYTNAGKSSLLNALTNKGAYVADELFATLETRVGKLYTKGQEILISDTIGFIQDLPPSLIQAFKSTLAETIDADLILHVIDIADPNIHKKIQVVEKILTQLKLNKTPKIYIFNKIDLIDYSALVKPEPDDHITKNSEGIHKASIHTAKKLGWDLDAPRESHKKLKKTYKEFDPVFVSANNKINLDLLTNSLFP